MNEKIKALYEKISGDESLMEAFQKGLEANSDDDAKKKFIIDFAKEQGIALTMEDFSKIADMQSIHDDELENAAGGAFGDDVKEKCGDATFAVCCAGFGISGLYDC